LVKMSHGLRARSRKKLSKRARERGLPPPSRFIQKFEIGDRVAIDIEPAVHKGMPHHKFQGRVGTVVGVRGRAYLVEVKDGGKRKIVISLPVHLKKVS